MIARSRGDVEMVGDDDAGVDGERSVGEGEGGSEGFGESRRRVEGVQASPARSVEEGQGPVVEVQKNSCDGDTSL